MAQSCSYDWEVKVSAKRMWQGMIVDAHNCLPKCSGDKIAAIEYHERQAVEVGCVRTVKFHKASHGALHVKEKFEEVDHEKLKVKISVIEGGLLGVIFKHYKFIFEFKEGGHAGISKVTWSLEYEGLTKHEAPEELKEGVFATIKAVEAFLLTNKELYA